MKSISIGSVLLSGIALVVAATGAPASGSLPLVDGEQIVATVNGESITLDEFAEALAQTHMSAAEGGAQAPKLDPVKLLDRLIAAELVTQEAESIGLDELPKVADSLKSYRTQALRTVLFGRYARTVTEPDATRVEQLYRSNVGEIKLESFVFATEEQARAIRARIDSAESFDRLVSEVDPEGGGDSHESYDFVRPGELLSGIRDALATLQPGQISPVVPVGRKFAIVKFVDVRYPEDPAARADAEQVVLHLQRQNALRQYTEELAEKYTTIDQKLLRALDYSPEGPGIEKFRADDRIVAKVRGRAQSITVAELTRAIEKKSFHGAERAMEKGKFDQRKHSTLAEICKKRALDAEIRAQRLEKSDEFLTMMENHRKGLLFGVFIDRVIDPPIKLDQQQVKKYLEDHKDEYSTPEMIRLDSLAFLDEQAAEKAAAKLRSGVDFIWLGRNAGGQAPPDSDPEPLHFDGRRPIVTGALPDGMRDAVANATAGDVRIFVDPKRYAYVLRLLELVPARPQEFDAIKDAVAQRVHRERRQEALDKWVGELRAASEIETFGTGETLLEALGIKPATRN